MNFESITLPSEKDEVAPDGSEIRLLPRMSRGSLSHCTLPVSVTSVAVSHRSIEEIWYVLSGQGQLWRKLGQQEEVVSLASGVSVTIPPETHFQFRNVGDQPLCILITTMPPWPGSEEAMAIEGYWKEASKDQTT